MKPCDSLWLMGVIALSFAAPAYTRAAETTEATASSSLADFAPAGAVDGNRFSAEQGAAWKGQPGQKEWWWQVRFSQPRAIGAILQVQGDHSSFLRNAPQHYIWQGSLDGET